MVTADDIGARRRRGGGVVSAVRWLLPFLAGAAWVLLIGALLASLFDVLPMGRGIRTPMSLFGQPLFFLMSKLPLGELGAVFLALGWVVLFGYYAVLTGVVWNAPRGFRQLCLAAALYGLHLVLNLVGTVLDARTFPVPGGSSRLEMWGDLEMLFELGRLAPIRLAAFGLLLLAWHGFVWWRLWLGANRRMRPAERFHDDIGSAAHGHGG